MVLSFFHHCLFGPPLICVTRFASFRFGVFRLLFSLVLRHHGLKQKTAAEEFDFPIPLNESSETMKEMKKVLAWKKVNKVISRMIAENENYRHRLKCQNLSSEIGVSTR
ncbi:uncharacterized protein C5orf47 homolog [Microtus ochrogaster]|uniref:Uncharacterized protein C5orf47 homolog n=1 Tax=Microtus ochrogaster TaxID=79684 RepID=A0ABM1AIG6_MICOH|nr:uncharacterized protein C5orf47 homolog [Microtus ochrogaster]